MEWTKEEDDYLKENYYKTSARQIAIDLKRSFESVRGRAARLQIRNKNHKWSEDDTRTLLRLHSEGYSYVDIAKELKCGLRTVKGKGMDLGLVGNSSIKGKKVSPRIRDHIKAIRNITCPPIQSRRRGHKQYIESRGWPYPEVNLRQCQILDYLCEFGQGTRKQMAEHIMGSYNLNSFGAKKSYLQDLVEKNFLCKLNTRPIIYMLGPKAIQFLEERIKNVGANKEAETNRDSQDSSSRPHASSEDQSGEIAL